MLNILLFTVFFILNSNAYASDNTEWSRCAKLTDSSFVLNSFKMYFDKNLIVTSYKDEEDSTIIQNIYIQDDVCVNPSDSDSAIVKVRLVKQHSFVASVIYINDLYFYFNLKTNNLQQIPIITDPSEASVLLDSSLTEMEFYFSSDSTSLLNVRYWGLLMTPALTTFTLQKTIQKNTEHRLAESDDKYRLVDLQIKKSSQNGFIEFSGLYLKYDWAVYDFYHGQGGYTYFTNMEYRQIDYAIDILKGKITIKNSSIVFQYEIDERYKNGFEETIKYNQDTDVIFFRVPYNLYFRRFLKQFPRPPYPQGW